MAGDHPTPRGYTVSPEARTQRKGAPWKTGLYDQSILGQVMPPCMRAKCPLGQEVFPCEVRQAADDAGRKLERCPVVLGEDASALQELADAILRGDLDPLAQGTALSMRLAKTILDKGLVEILQDGLTVEEAVVHDGEVLTDVVKYKTHPSAKPVTELLQILGVTADQQQLTPKSQGDKRMKESFTTLADRMAARRQALQGSTQ